MITVRTRPLRLVSFFGLMMLLLSVTPLGIAAQTGITPGEEIAQGTGPAIELLVGQCPFDAPQDPSDLQLGCLQNGLADVNVQVTATDPTLGIDQPKVTVRPQVPGPGVINTGPIPLGEYRVSVNLPIDQYRFFFECRVRGTETAVPTTATLDAAPNAFLVTTSGTADIVCSAYVTPLQAPPSIEITYRECSSADLTGDGRTFEDLQPNCATVSTDPPTFNVRDLNTAGQPVSQHQLDAEGKLKLTLAPGNYDFFTDLEMDDWEERLFCEYGVQPRYEKEFNADRGIVTFTNMLPGEEFRCNWFAIESTDEAQGNQPGQQSQARSSSQSIQVQGDDPTVAITYRECTRGDLPTTSRTYQDLGPNCDTISSAPPTVSLLTNGTTTEHTLDATGVVTIPLGQGRDTLTTGLNPNEWGQYLFCEYQGQTLYEKKYEAVTGDFTFVDIGNEQIRCDWFAVKASQTPSGEVIPPTNPTTNGSIALTLLACESADAVVDTSSLEAFRTNCTAGVGNVAFNLTNDRDPQRTAVTDAAGKASFADIPAGTWRLWNEIPLEAVTEYYFCADQSGVYTAYPLSDRGVASFTDFSGEKVTCEVYLIQEDLRGEITGASVEVHLSACPIGYAGSNWYNDCHGNGVDGQEFTLSGPGGDQTESAEIARTPGPGIATFTELPAGDYILAGGPPQDFGSVFLYCSDPSTNTQVTTQFVDGRGRFSLTENQSIVCDWYFVPDDQGAPTPSPTPAPVEKKAEIFTTMFICPPGVNVAGATFGQLDDACTQRLSNVPMTLQSPGGVPITASTGASGEGAIRFYDLVDGNYVLTPTLPAEYVSAAVYCDLNGGNVYQKALSNGATTFTNVDGELISCSWFVTAKQQPQQTGPTGSITIREMLCEGDRATIVDWERECQPGASGVSFTITSSGGAVTQTLSPNDEGVAVFTGLANEYYDVKQSEGAWCRAKAERVDAQSRVIVANGGNTDVFLYQCNQDLGLPNTGAGPMTGDTTWPFLTSLVLGVMAMPLFAIAIRRWSLTTVAGDTPVVRPALSRTRNGYRYR